jgi:hypothetical protein
VINFIFLLKKQPKYSEKKFAFYRTPKAVYNLQMTTSTSFVILPFFRFLSVQPFLKIIITFRMIATSEISDGFFIVFVKTAENLCKTTTVCKTPKVVCNRHKDAFQFKLFFASFSIVLIKKLYKLEFLSKTVAPS